MAKNLFFEAFVKNHSGFVESNVQAAIAWFCLVFRAFSQINSSTSWPTVGGGPTVHWREDNFVIFFLSISLLFCIDIKYLGMIN